MKLFKFLYIFKKLNVLSDQEINQRVPYLENLSFKIKEKNLENILKYYLSLKKKIINRKIILIMIHIVLIVINQNYFINILFLIF